MSAQFRWPWSMSIHLSPRSVAAGVRPFPLAMQYAAFLFICLQGLSLVVPALFRWPCSTSIGHAAFLFICLPVSALFRWPCIFRWPSRSVDATFLSICLPGLSFLFTSLSHVISLLLSPRFGACTAGVRPFPLAVRHFYSFASQVMFYFCP